MEDLHLDIQPPSACQTKQHKDYTTKNKILMPPFTSGRSIMSLQGSRGGG